MFKLSLMVLSPILFTSSFALAAGDDSGLINVDVMKAIASDSAVRGVIAALQRSEKLKCAPLTLNALAIVDENSNLISARFSCRDLTLVSNPPSILEVRVGVYPHRHPDGYATDFRSVAINP